MKQTRNEIDKGAGLRIIAVIVSVMLLASMPMATAKLYGDANGDNVIDEADITYVEQIIAGEKTKTELADANQDGKIDLLDVAYIEGIILGDNPFPRGTLIAGLGRDPGKQYGYGAHPSLTGVYEQLVWLDYELEPQPMLATSWKVSEAGKVWTFYLREGVKFHANCTAPDDFSRIGDNDYHFSIQFHRGWITGCFGSKSERKDDRKVER